MSAIADEAEKHLTDGEYFAFDPKRTFGRPELNAGFRPIKHYDACSDYISIGLSGDK
jgi:hypothetical protein